MKPPEIRFVTSPRLINHGKELEVDLVHAPGKVNGKRLAVTPRHNPGS